MNHIHKTVFNRVLGLWQVASELAKAQGKSSSSSFCAEGVCHHRHSARSRGIHGFQRQWILRLRAE
ncbi:MAG: ESPR domain-containing protein [Methylobacillus sp.]|nr:ESPR domain-containing protein [Methylobacillus sp.]